MRAGRDGHQVGPGALLPVDGGDELVEDVRVRVVLAKVDNVDVDLNTIVTRQWKIGFPSHLLFLEFLC